MKSAAIVALLLCGFLLRFHGWQALALGRKSLGSALVVGGTIVTLSIVALLALISSAGA